MKSAEGTIEFTSGLPYSLLTAIIILIMTAISWGFLILAFDITAIEYSSFYSLRLTNAALNFGGASYAYY